MTIYQVSTEWEYNGRDDSDFYVVTFNDETEEITRFEVGSTRYAADFSRTYGMLVKLADVPEEIWIRAEAAYAKRAAQMLLSADRIRRERFCANVGETVILTRDVQNRPRAQVEVECFKCGGLGYWMNPRNVNDKRPCFKCNGTKVAKVSKACKGKAITHKQGSKGEVLAVFENRSQYGTWDYGSRATIRLVDGSIIKAPVSALIAAREPMSQLEAETTAAKVAKRRNFYPMFATAGALSLVHGGQACI